MYQLDISDLASYPGVKIPTTATGELIVRLVEGKINSILDNGPNVVDNADVDPIALESAARALQNPTGATSITTGLDDWKQTLRYEGELALSRRAGVHLTDAEALELRRLAGLVPTKRKRRGSITTRPGY